MYSRELAKKTKETFKAGSVIPIIEISNADHAKPLADALCEGGLNIIEITLRTDAAFEAISRISKIKSLTVGAGTVLSPQHAQNAAQAGAQFLVSPGSTTEIINTCARLQVPFLPGASTVSEMMRLREQNFSLQKFFPAEASGGTKFLSSVAAVLPDVTFCPTGGVSSGNMKSYLSLPNVCCVGGSWIAPKALIESENWSAISNNTQTCKAAVRQGL